MTESINQKTSDLTNHVGNILAFESSTKNYHIAVSPKNSNSVYEISSTNYEIENFFRLTDRILEETKIALSEIENIVCLRGPSSFTGIRKNLTIATALTFCSKTKVFTISCLAAQCYLTHKQTQAEVVFVANDARREEVFFAAYGFKDKTTAYCLEKDSLVKPEDITIPDMDPEQTLSMVGNGWEQYQKKLPKRLRGLPTVKIKTVLPSALISFSLKYPNLLETMTEDAQPNYLRHPVK